MVSDIRTNHKRNQMSRRHVDNWSHPGHYPVDPYTWPWSPNGHSWSWSWMTYCHSLCAMSMGPPILRYSNFKQLFQNLTMKIHGQGHVWSKVKVTFDVQNSKVKVMVKVICHIWGLEFNRYACFSFRGNQTIFGWDIGNSIFDLEN